MPNLNQSAGSSFSPHCPHTCSPRPGSPTSLSREVFPTPLQKAQQLEVATSACRKAINSCFTGGSPRVLFKIPYMSNMIYSPELYEKLAGFARSHSHHKLNATALLFAVQIWVDITEHPTFMLEPFANKPNNTQEVPHVSLAVFLLYFESWLKVHELMRCLQYIHPFRLIQKMFLSDIRADAAGFRVGMNESAVRALVLKATTLRSELPVTARVDYFPFMMNGTSMAHPHGIAGCTPLSPTHDALVGMPSITILDLPSLHRDNTNRRIVALPTPIAKLSFNPIQSIMDETQVLGGLQYVLGPNATSQFGPDFNSGTIWTHEFVPELDMDSLHLRESLPHETPMSTPSTSPSNQEAGLKDLTILGATAKKLRRDGDIGEIEDHVLQLLPGPVQSPTEQSPAEVMLLRAIAQLKAELDTSQLAEILQPLSQTHTDGYGTSDNPLVIDALPASQAPVTGSTPSTTAGPASTVPFPNPIFSTAPSTTTGPASTVTAPTSNPAADFSLQGPDVFQRSESELGPWPLLATRRSMRGTEMKDENASTG
ncbi:hypothetical protein NCS52_01223300 [Fusarium sp. LHS14.1]|nr:hypothetical protein NCS52_01223300 [Fusarium sp. LHS14.1]